MKKLMSIILIMILVSQTACSINKQSNVEESTKYVDVKKTDLAADDNLDQEIEIDKTIEDNDKVIFIKYAYEEGQTDQQSSSDDEDIQLNLDNFIKNLENSEFKKSAEEAGYECVYDGLITYKEYEIFYNQSDFFEESIIHFVLRENHVETLYNVDLENQLAKDFNNILSLFDD